MMAIFGRRVSQQARRYLLIATTVAGLAILGLFVAAGVVLDRHHRHYGAFFPGRTPPKLTYCGGRHYLRSGPTTRTEAEAGGSLVAVGHTPGGATLFGPGRLAVVAGRTLCPTVIWAADPDDAHILSYALSGGP
jgi:hypothetical protein